MKTKLILLLSLILLLVWSCAPVYVPSTHAAPLLEKKDDVHTSIYTGSNGINAQFAYAATDDIGVQINGFYLKDEDEEDDHTDRKSIYGEIAFGKYGKLNNYFRVGSYLGAGTGWSRAWKEDYDLFWDDEDDGEYVKGHFNKFFAFSNIAFTTRVIDCGIGIKLSYVDFYKLVNESTHDSYRTSRSAFFAEPAVFTRFGFDVLKFETIIGITKPVNKTPKFDYDPLYVSFGIHLNWGADKK